MATFAKEHASTIACIAVGVLVGAACTALTGGTAVVGCVALAALGAGLAGSLCGNPVPFECSELVAA